jgi:hypothetical protein
LLANALEWSVPGLVIAAVFLLLATARSDAHTRARVAGLALMLVGVALVVLALELVLLR